MQIREIMTRNVETASPLMSLQEAARKMEKRDVGFLPVVSEGSLVGVITDRDITVRAVSRGLDSKQSLVEKVMTHDAIVLPENSDLEDAADLMEEHDIRRLVVTDENEQPVGVVSKDRIALYLGAYAMDNGTPGATQEFPEDFDPAGTLPENDPTTSAGTDESRPVRVARDQGDPARRR
jgi:CBS domain-containing protein